MRFKRETLEVIAILVIAGIILGGVIVAYPFIQRSNDGCSGDGCKVSTQAVLNASNKTTGNAKALVLPAIQISTNTPEL